MERSRTIVFSRGRAGFPRHIPGGSRAESLHIVPNLNFNLMLSIGIRCIFFFCVQHYRNTVIGACPHDNWKDVCFNLWGCRNVEEIMGKLVIGLTRFVKKFSIWSDPAI